MKRLRKNIKVRMNPYLKTVPMFCREPYPDFFDMDHFIVYEYATEQYDRHKEKLMPILKYLTTDHMCYFYADELEFLNEGEPDIDEP